MNYRAFLCCLLFPLLIAHADEQVRRGQEELRKRHLYFGDVDGRKTPETSGAIRRYQARKGLAVTGDLTPETLSSLEITAPLGSAEELPEGVVLKSDSAKELSESDRKFLEETASGELPAVAEPPVSDPPETLSKPPDSVEAPPPARPVEDLARETREFVLSYLAACETNQLDAEMKFYADPIYYFENGMVDHLFVSRDVQRFYRRWPQRHYELLDLKLNRVQGTMRDVTFRIAFRYKNMQQSAAGQTLNFFKIRQEPSGLIFTSMKEQRVRN